MISTIVNHIVQYCRDNFKLIKKRLANNYYNIMNKFQFYEKHKPKLQTIQIKVLSETYNN